MVKTMITIDDKKYELIKEERDAFDLQIFKDHYTEYFANYDYIVGDWAYGKLRLKGFNDKSNREFNAINDYSKIDEYIKEYCAYGCKYFVLKRIKVEPKQDL